MKQPAVYIMASRRNGTLYTGVTSDLPARVWQHRKGHSPGFTRRYGCKLLVWYEVGGDMEAAILREKQIKAGSRRKKLALIEALNPQWDDLYETIVHLERSDAGIRPRRLVRRPHWIASLRSQ